jgi:type I restriction enzyme S subunit
VGFNPRVEIRMDKGYNVQLKISGGGEMQQEIKERILMIDRGDVPEGYKRTKVAIIPINWDIDSMKNIGEWIGGYAFKSEDFLNYPTNCSFQVIKMGNVKMNKLDIENNVAYMDVASIEEKHNKYLLKQGDILVSLTGTINNTDYGNVAVIEEGNKYFLNQRVGCFRISNSNRKNYYYFYMQGKTFRSKFFILGVGGTGNQANVSINDLNNLLVVKPPKLEQQKITSILSTWDKAIDLKEKLLAQKQEQKKGLMQNLLTGRVRVNEIGTVNSQKIKERIAMIRRGEVPEGYKKTRIGIMPMDWRVEKAKSIFRNISFKNNGDEKLLSVTQDRGVLPRSILGQRVMMPEGDTQSYKLVLPNQYIISLRSFEGGIELSNYRGVVSPAYTVLENIKEIDYNFYKYLFKKEDFIRRMNSAVIGIRDGKQISYADFAELLIQNPDVNEQKEISRILALSDTQLDLLTQELSLLKQQKKGLMQLLLTGIVRVKY